MPKFKRIIHVIDAEQFSPADWESHEPNHRLSGIRKQGDQYYIHTLEGPILLAPGDWIITGTMGEKYPCKPHIFQQLYEPVNDDSD